MQIVYRYNLQPGKASDYLDWLKKNDDVFRKEAAPGWTYIATWSADLVRVASSRWELDDYSALGAGFGTENFQTMLNEWADSVDVNSQEVSLLKSEEDVAIP